MTSVAASGVSIRSIDVNTVDTRTLAAGSSVRSRLNFASADENGSPLCHLTPGRSLKRQVVCPSSFHSVARPGWSFWSGWRETRLSNTLKDTRISFAEVLMCGSKVAMSPPWATTRSRFWVV